MIPARLKKLFAFGSGIGVEISRLDGSESLHISAVRVRPTGARVLARLTIENFEQQPASLWGTEYANFARKLGMRHVGATVILPRNDVIVRQLSLPGVSDNDLDSAIGFQLDGLHPYPEDDVIASWSRLGASGTVVVAIARRAAVDHYATLFSEAGIKVASFTCSAAAIYSALRIFNAPPPLPILAIQNDADTPGSTIDIYGESATRQFFSASFDASVGVDRAVSLASAELRVESPSEPQSLDHLLRAAPAVPFVAGLASACPRLSLSLNLLPVEQRHASAGALWIPTTAIGVIVLMLAGALWAFPGYENRKYIQSLDTEIARVQPAAKRVESIERAIDTARRRSVLLDDFRRRAKSDMDVLVEMTRVLPPPTWLNTFDITRNAIFIAGETDQAAPLLKTIDASPLFEASEFAAPPVRTMNGEIFRIRATREAVKEVAK